jgi:hypothetical protein
MAFIPRIEINGAIKTSDNVLANINKIAAACQSFVTWDPSSGTWKTLLNRQGSSVMTFDDSNIVGSITVSGAGVTDLYNSVRVGFSNKDSDGRKDERVLSVDPEDRFDRELDNQLSMDFEFVNDPVQAEILGAIELKQSRLDKIIEFSTDYRAITLRAGDIIGVSNEYYFEQSSTIPKLFRVITIEEIDGDDGGILLVITALEYSGNVYNTDGLTREERLVDSGIPPKSTNVCVIEKENVATGNRIGAALQTDAGRAAITAAGVPLFQTYSEQTQGSTIQTTFNAAYSNDYYFFNKEAYLWPGTAPGDGVYDPKSSPHWFTAAEFSTQSTIKTMQIAFTGPQATYTYDVDGVTKEITAGIPCKIDLFYAPSSTGPWLWQDGRFMEWSSYISSFVVSNLDVAPVFWMVFVTPLNTYDLNAADNTVLPLNISSVITDNQDDGPGTGDAAYATVSLFLN